MGWPEPKPRFVPHPMLRDPHLQTIAGAYLWRKLPHRAVSHQVPLPDLDRLVVHEDIDRSRPEAGRSALILHGLAGCHGSGYVQRLASKLNDRGFHTWRLDMRGCGAGAALARQSLHAGRTDDVRHVLRFVQQQTSGEPITLVGFSLGASITLKMLATLADADPHGLDSAIAVAPPLDLEACCQNLAQGINRLYDRSFVKRLRREVKRRARLVPDMQGGDWRDRPQSLYQFDASFTAPHGGFESVEHYYRQSSSLAGLPQIKIPTRILFAEDDPLVPSDVFYGVGHSAVTQIWSTPAGGHLGYLANRQATSDPDWHWMDWRIVDWVEDFHESKSWDFDRSPPEPGT